jgi:hypothetical protein
MTSLYATGSGPVTSIVNYFSSGGTSTSASIASVVSHNAKEIMSGALTAATLKTLLTRTGRGRLNLLTAFVADATSRTVRVQVIVDGTTIYDATSNAITNPGSGVVPVGVVTAATGALEMQPIEFQTSLEIKLASSLTETDKVSIGVNYEDWL